jgi:DNA-binding transcriptional ArsR family regulator
LHVRREKRARELVGYEPDRDLVLDPRGLKGLAHPLRVRLRAELVLHGPATASQLAARVGESSGSTSYHLRQLAVHGFVVEEPNLGHGRERYWRAVHRSTWYVSSSEPSERQVGSEYVRAVAHTYADRLVRFASAVEAASEVLGDEWARSWDISDWGLALTPEQAEQLARDFHELCAPYRREPANSPPGTRVVHVQFQIMPAPKDQPGS